MLKTSFRYLSCCDMQRRVAKEARAQELQAKNAAHGKKVKEPAATNKGMKGRGEASFYRVTCKVCDFSLHTKILQFCFIVFLYAHNLFFDQYFVLKIPFDRYDFQDS